MEKYKRENNQLKCRNGLQMNHFKDSSLSLEYANSCEVILLWFCSDDHEKWLSADNNLQEHQTKFNDKNLPVESVFALSHAFGSRTLILHTAELLGKMQIVIVLFILTVMHRPLNYHAIEISSFYSNCFKESYIWESKKAFGRNTNEKNEERRIIKET